MSRLYAITIVQIYRGKMVLGSLGRRLFSWMVTFQRELSALARVEAMRTGSVSIPVFQDISLKVPSNKNIFITH